MVSLVVSQRSFIETLNEIKAKDEAAVTKKVKRFAVIIIPRPVERRLPQPAGILPRDAQHGLQLCFEYYKFLYFQKPVVTEP